MTDWQRSVERGRVALERQERLHTRHAGKIGLLGFLLAAALPALLFHRTIALVAESYQLTFRYLVGGWAPWALMALGLLFLLPVAISAGRDPESRLYPRARNAYAGWGITLYLLGFGLATQVAQIVDGSYLG
jgi:hypothetical protein